MFILQERQMKYDNADKENITFIKWYERFYN